MCCNVVSLSVCGQTQLQVCPLSVCCQFVCLESEIVYTHTHLHLLVRDILPAVRASLWSHRAFLSLVLGEDMGLDILSTLSALDLTKLTFAQVFLRGREGGGGRKGGGGRREGEAISF